MSDQPSLYRPRHVVVLAHPERRSFNGLVADAYCEAVISFGHEAIVRDLYQMGFDPLLKATERPDSPRFAIAKDVEAELAAIGGSDVFVLVYPIWFGMPPAMMIGYLDRVLGAGVPSNAVQHRAAITPLRGKRLVSISSSGASKMWLNQEDQIDSLRNIFGRYLHHAFGLKDFEDLHFGETVEGLSQDFVDQNMGQVRDRARAICEAVQADRQKHETAVA